MRIIAGELGGRRLLAPKGDSTRPTSDRVRESLFSILGAPPTELAVLDLFAGAGTLGLEALSRGAARATFIEGARGAASVLRQNISSLAVSQRAEVIVAKLPAALERRSFTARRFGWIFVDPPYQSTLGDQTLEILGRSPILDDDSLVVVEHDRRRAPAAEVGCLVRTDRRRYGDTEISFYRRSES